MRREWVRWAPEPAVVVDFHFKYRHLNCTCARLLCVLQWKCLAYALGTTCRKRGSVSFSVTLVLAPVFRSRCVGFSSCKTCEVEQPPVCCLVCGLLKIQNLRIDFRTSQIILIFLPLETAQIICCSHWEYFYIVHGVLFLSLSVLQKIVSVVGASQGVCSLLWYRR